MKSSVARHAIVLALSAFFHLTPTNCFADNISTSIIQDGGTFTNASGTLIVGSNSESSPAVLTLKNGATTSGILNLAIGTSANPTPTPGDEGGPLENYYGAIEVLSGSTLITGSADIFTAAYIGFNPYFSDPIVIPTGEVTVSGTGSSWNHAGTIVFNFVANGSLDINSGGKLLTHEATISFLNYSPDFSTTTATVTGPGSKWINDGYLKFRIIALTNDQTPNVDLALRDSGSLEVAGTLQTSSANVITVDGGSITADKIWNSGTINILDGTVTTNDFLNTVDYDNHQLKGQLNLFGGTLTVKEGTFHSQGSHEYGDRLTIDANNSTSIPTLKLTDGASNFDPIYDSSDPYYYLTTEIGKSAHGQLIVDNQSEFRSEQFFLGTEENGNGTIRISNQSTLKSLVGFKIGIAEGATAEITVESGSTATTLFNWESTRIGLAQNSMGIVTIKGDGSTWTDFGMIIGDKGNGTLNILDGAVVSSGDPTPTTSSYQPTVIIANAAGSKGDVTVDGKNTEWSTGGLVVGSEGIGALRIQNGAQVKSEYATLGAPATYTSNPTSGVGDALVTGEDSAWNITSRLYVGSSSGTSQGQGQLKILNGAAVICDSTIVASPTPNTIASVIISGESSTLLSLHGFWVGSFRTYITDAGIFLGNGHANLVVENGAHLISPDTFVEFPSIGYGLLLTQGGTISGDGGFIVGDVANWGGTISPGSSPGIMTIDGNYSQESRKPPYLYTNLPVTSELQIELAGLDQGISYDFLHVTGITTLGGLLTLDILDGFEDLITATDTFTILTSDGGLTGDFSNLDLHHRLNMRQGSFLVSYENNSVVLSDFVAVPESGSLLLAAVGVAGFALAARRRMSRIG